MHQCILIRRALRTEEGRYAYRRISMRLQRPACTLRRDGDATIEMVRAHHFGRSREPVHAAEQTANLQFGAKESDVSRETSGALRKSRLLFPERLPEIKNGESCGLADTCSPHHARARRAGRARRPPDGAQHTLFQHRAILREVSGLVGWLEGLAQNLTFS
jgi:hypothetical protein